MGRSMKEEIKELLEQIEWASKILTDNDAKSLLKPECKMLLDYIVQLRKERDDFEMAIKSCLGTANGRESEWGSRAKSAFEPLYKAIHPDWNLEE